MRTKFASVPQCLSVFFSPRSSVWHGIWAASGGVPPAQPTVVVVWVPFLESQDTRQYPGHINNAWRMVLNSLTWPSLNMSIMTYQKNWISGSKHFRVWMKWFSHCIFSENWKISVRLLDEKKNIIFVLAFIKISKKKKKKKDNSHSRVLSRVQVCEVPSV